MPKPSARARMDAYMVHESDADQAEFTARVHAVVAEARARFVEELAEELGGYCPECDACISIAREKAADTPAP